MGGFWMYSFSGVCLCTHLLDHPKTLWKEKPFFWFSESSWWIIAKSWNLESPNPFFHGEIAPEKERAQLTPSPQPLGLRGLRESSAQSFNVGIIKTWNNSCFRVTNYEKWTGVNGINVSMVAVFAPESGCQKISNKLVCIMSRYK